MKKIIGIVIIITIVITVGLFAFRNKAEEVYYCNDIEFNAKEWLANRVEYYKCPIRSKMVNDLINNKKLIALDYDHLINLLGKPDKKDEDVVIYWIGPTTNSQTKEAEFLYIKLDMLGSVANAARRHK